MHWPITTKPRAICNEQGSSRPSSKSLFRNNIQLLSPQPATSATPKDIRSCIADVMRLVCSIPINGLSPLTFKAWAISVVSYLRPLPGSTLHLVFDNYSSDHNKLYLSKSRPDRGRERITSDLS